MLNQLIAHDNRRTCWESDVLREALPRFHVYADPENVDPDKLVCWGGELAHKMTHTPDWNYARGRSLSGGFIVDTLHQIT